MQADRATVVSTGALVLALAVFGCTTVSAYLRLPHDEQRLFDVYQVFMTSAQQAAYLRRPTAESRQAYAESLGLQQRLAALTEAEREAVLKGVVTEGMSTEGLLMAWGHPYRRAWLGGQDEKWVYLPYYSKQLSPSTAMHVYLQAGRVAEWTYEVIPAPDGKP